MTNTNFNPKYFVNNGYPINGSINSKQTIGPSNQQSMTNTNFNPKQTIHPSNQQSMINSNINPDQTIDPSNEPKRKINEKSKNKLDLLLKACKESELSDQSNMDIIKEKTKV